MISLTPHDDICCIDDAEMYLWQSSIYSTLMAEEGTALSSARVEDKRESENLL